MINIIFIAIICCIVTDRTDFMEFVKNILLFFIRNDAMYSYVKKNGIQILNCSFCQTFWLSTIYVLIYNNLTLFNIFLCLIAAISTKYINYVLDIIDSCLVKIYKKLM